MVNKAYTKKTVGVKSVDLADKKDQATAKGGVCLLEATASRMSLWSMCRRYLPQKTDTTQGYQTDAMMGSMCYGFLTGGKNYCLTEPMRDDTPLLKIIGLKQAPSTKTVDRFVEYIQESKIGMEGLCDIAQRQATWTINRMEEKELLVWGFLPAWVDGSMLETRGKTKDCIKTIKGKDKGKNKLGQIAVGSFVGQCYTGGHFALENQGELTVGRGLFSGMSKVLKKTGMASKALVLLDSLYGDEPTLKQVEKHFKNGHYIIGAGKLKQAHTTLEELPEVCWKNKGANKKRGWEEYEVCHCKLQCKDWDKSYRLIGLRYRKENEMIWNYCSVITNLTENEERIKAIMEKKSICFEQAIWMLYAYKQAMENYWKELLIDMGLHFPPSGKAKKNAVFFAIAAISYNLSVATRVLSLGTKEHKRMRLWRFIRDFVDMACRVSFHARQVMITSLDAREQITTELKKAILQAQKL